MAITIRSAQTIGNGVTLRGNNTQYIAPPPTLPLLFELDASIYASGTTLLDQSGNIAFVKVYNGVLTLADVQSLYATYKTRFGY